MSFDFQNPTAFDHLESARRLNKAMVLRCKSRRMDPEWFLQMAMAQARNIDAAEEMLAAKIAEFNDLPKEAVQQLNEMIASGEDELLAEAHYAEFPDDRPQKDNVVTVDFVSLFKGGRKDG